ncbi:9698_t:CDS:1, partial [Cetraspora pellucida]
QKYLLNRNVNTIFKKFLTEELEDAIIDYDFKIKNLDFRTSKDLETQKNWKKLILDNQNMISYYNNYKNYLNYKLDKNNISLDYSEKFIKNRKVINAKEKLTLKFLEYNKNFYESILKRIETEKNDKEKFKDNRIFDKEIKLLRDEFLSKNNYKISILQELRKNILSNQ